MNIKDMVVRYGIMFGKRTTKKEKERFIQVIGNDFKEQGYEVRATVSKDTGVSAINLIVGNLAEAKNIIIVHYDTPPLSILPNYKHFPFDGNKTYQKAKLTNNIGLIIAFVLGLILVVLASMYADFSSVNVSSVSFGIGIILISLLTIKLEKGFANKYNFNNNSMAIVVALDIANTLKEKDKKKVAIVLTDKECFNFKGDKMVVENLPKTIQDRNVIHISCVAYGKVVGVASSKENKAFAEKMISYYKGDKVVKQYVCNEAKRVRTSLMNYPKMISIASGIEYDKSLLVENTRSQNDVEFDLEHMEEIKKMVVEFIKNER